MVQLRTCSFDCDKCDIGSRGGSFHQSVLKTICLLGRRNGLQTVDEWSAPAYSGGVQPKTDEYTPSIDLVWLLDIKNIIGEPNFNKLHSIISSWTKKKIPRDGLRFIPYASFEVEVSDPTSKTIYSDFHNLIATRSVIKFEVIREVGDMNIGAEQKE